MGREEHCKQISLARVGSFCSAPTHCVCAFMVYTSQALGCSAKELSEVGPGLHALPRSRPLSFSFLGNPQGHRLGLACVLCPSQVQAAQATRCLVSSFSPGGVEHLITHLSQPFSFLGVQWEHHLRCAVVSLLWGGNLWLQPTWQMSTIQDPKKTWLASGSLLSIWLRMPLWS